MSSAVAVVAVSLTPSAVHSPTGSRREDTADVTDTRPQPQTSGNSCTGHLVRDCTNFRRSTRAVRSAQRSGGTTATKRGGLRRPLSLTRPSSSCRQTKKRGVYKGRKPKLTASQVAELRELAVQGVKKPLLAEQFGVSRKTVYEYLRE